MSHFEIREKRFEQDIEEYLITKGGYEKIYGTDSEKQVVERFCREVKMVGLLQGFTD